ncbi:MAG: hypothetical protein M5U28_50140 [Sandaracinaceae bacterium]|nr:hypothetical protein [Sandaracinaceae bacterium]
MPATGAHSAGAAPRQVPAPSHASPVVHASPSSHGTELPWSAHAPAPSHDPVVPQELGGSSAHSDSGSVPAAWGVQLPSRPGRSHARQPPSQA